MTENTKPKPDWEKIELLYRAGILSLREIAEQHPQTNHVAITRRAKKEGWTRDLSEKIKIKAESIVTKSGVTADVTAERDIVESGAQAIANIRLSHRGDIARFRKLSLKLLDELESQTDNNDLYAELGELLRQEGDNGQDRRNDLYNKVIDLPSRIDGSKKLAETLKHLITLEREAYGINDAQKIEVSTTDKRSVSSEDAAQAYMAMLG